MLRSLIVVMVYSLALASVHADDMYVYFGTHVVGPGKGFSLSHFDTDTGVLTKPKYLIDAVAPAFFVIDSGGKHLYTCNSGRPGGVSSYEIDPKTGALKLLNSKSAGGANTSYISLDKTGRFALSANYEGGNIEVWPIQPDGSFGERTAFIQHTGRGIDPQRQTHAYAHSIITDPTNRFALSGDLGVDKVFVYRFDEKAGTLAPNDPPSVSIKPGSGARHVKFHPNGKWVYLISEMGSTVTAFNWDTAKGTLAEFQTVSTLPADFKGASACAEMEIHPNGKFLYGSNRGHDSLVVFAIDQSSGKLLLVQHISSAGKTPRNFAFDPTGKWIICTNHDSNNAVVFKIDENTGKLTQVGEPMDVPYPFCERFLPVPKS
jgi:6-phosphogluconolactonase